MSTKDEDKKPSDWELEYINTVPVVGAILLNAQKNRILLTQRRFNDRFGPGLWECPGGKLDTNESEEAGLARELYEEIGLQYEVPPMRYRRIAFSPHESMVLFGGSRRLEISFYLVCVPDNWTPDLTEVDGAGWFTLETALTLPLTPGTQCVLQVLAETRAEAYRRQGY